MNSLFAIKLFYRHFLAELETITLVIITGVNKRGAVSPLSAIDTKTLSMQPEKCIGQ
ncbi:hypothetical protein [Enterobacter kobei]|uniref:hypothetical protein n=1 Tax=Enterobacter kobei TaxID=208224 RepID=UPI003A97217D